MRELSKKLGLYTSLLARPSLLLPKRLSLANYILPSQVRSILTFKYLV